MSLPAVIEDQAEEDVLVVTDMASLRAAVVTRRNELGLSQLAVDEIAGIQPGYLAKLEIGMKNFGPMSLGCVMGALGIELVVRRVTPHHVKQGRI